MGNFSKGTSHKVEHLVENYDWQALGSGTVVDVSGPRVFSCSCFLPCWRVPGLTLVVLARWFARTH